MIELFDHDRHEENRRSSKGNQLKWRTGEFWYKADYLGYEGLAEYVVSCLLAHSDLPSDMFVLYDTEEILYKKQTFTGCRSRHFLQPGEQLITLERLFFQHYGRSLYRAIFDIREEADRFAFLAEQTEKITGLSDFGRYLCILMETDALFLNEDRHTHNIAVIMNEKEEYRLCPAFDYGGSLLSDTRIEYPMEGDIPELIRDVRAKTISSSFENQVDTAEAVCGQNLRFSFREKDVEDLLQQDSLYPAEVKKRVRDVLFHQMRKYAYLFR